MLVRISLPAKLTVLLQNMTEKNLRKKSKKTNSTTRKPIKKVALIIISIAVFLDLICAFHYFVLGQRKFYFFFVTFLMVLYHVLIRFLTPRVLGFLHKKPYNSNLWWFKEKEFEKPFYKLLKVKNWKSRLITANPEAYSLKSNSLEGIIQATCIAEVLHELLSFFSFISIFFGLIFGRIWIFVLVAMFFTSWEFRFVVAQRYNRPRVQNLIQIKLQRQK